MRRIAFTTTFIGSGLLAGLMVAPAGPAEAATFVKPRLTVTSALGRDFNNPCGVMVFYGTWRSTNPHTGKLYNPGNVLYADEWQMHVHRWGPLPDGWETVRQSGLNATFGPTRNPSGWIRGTFSRAKKGKRYRVLTIVRSSSKKYLVKRTVASNELKRC